MLNASAKYSKMIVSAVGVLAILGAVMADTYIINPVPGGAYPPYAPPPPPPAYNYPPYKGYQNFTRPNGTGYNNNARCIPHGYDLPKSHSLFAGCKQAGDKLLYTEIITKAGRFFSTREKVIDYPGEMPKGHVRDDNITAIWCYDTRGYGKGGFCTIMNGGIGKKHVRVHMYHNERNTPLNFKLEIYGNTTAGNKLH